MKENKCCVKCSVWIIKRIDRNLFRQRKENFSECKRKFDNNYSSECLAFDDHDYSSWFDELDDVPPLPQLKGDKQKEIKEETGIKIQTLNKLFTRISVLLDHIKNGNN